MDATGSSVAGLIATATSSLEGSTHSLLIKICCRSITGRLHCRFNSAFGYGCTPGTVAPGPGPGEAAARCGPGRDHRNHSLSVGTNDCLARYRKVLICELLI